MGQPLGTYIQSLIVLAMLATELVRQSSTRVIRFRRLRQLQICTIAVLFFSLLVTLFTADYQFTASPGALQALAVFNIIGILALCLVFLAYIVLGYKDKAAGWLVSGKRHLKASASRSRGLKQFVTSPSRMGRQPSSDPMLLSGMTSPASSSFQMSRAASGHAPGDMRRSSSVLSSQDIAALWSGTDATRTQGN